MAALTEEQELLRDQAATWAREEAPVARFREMRDSGNEFGFDKSTWASIGEMGWAGIVVPEAYGGVDMGYLTFGVVLEQLGQQLTASPLFASGLVGASALVLGGSDAQKEKWLPKIAEGSAIVTLAVDEGPRHAPRPHRPRRRGHEERPSAERREDPRARRPLRRRLRGGGAHEWPAGEEVGIVGTEPFLGGAGVAEEDFDAGDGEAGTAAAAAAAEAAPPSSGGLGSATAPDLSLAGPAFSESSLSLIPSSSIHSRSLLATSGVTAAASPWAACSDSESAGATARRWLAAPAASRAW